MCGACGHAVADERVAGPRRRAASAAAVSALTGLSVKVALGVWTVSTPTGRQEVCATVDDLASAAARLSGLPAAQVAAVAVDAAR